MRPKAHLILALLAVSAVARAFAIPSTETPAQETPALETAAPTLPDAAQAAPPADWSGRLHALLADVDARFDGELGVSVVDLATGQALSYRGDEPWYLASGIKVPVAIALLRAVEAGELALDGELLLHADDLVDGAGPTVRRAPGTALRIDWLLEQMLVHSDNTATDVLIRRLGIERVNAVASELMPGGCGRITTLADVRRHAYSALHPAARGLSSSDLLALKRAPFGRARYETLAGLLGVSPGELLLADIGSAFDSYYASALNTAPLDQYAGLLVALAQGRALGPQSTAYLFEVLGRVETGRQRIVAGLPAGARFAHKTGTQLHRQCDFGIVTRNAADGTVRQLAVAACHRNASLRQGEAALREVGRAIGASGALDGPPTPPAVHAEADPGTHGSTVAPG